MRTGMGISDYVSMIAIMAMLVSLWMHESLGMAPGLQAAREEPHETVQDRGP